MKVKISKISIHQTSKVIAIFHGVFSSFFFLPMAIFLFMMGENSGGLMTLFYPLFLMLFCYIAVALTCWVYNLIASSFGGIEFTLSEENKAE